MLMCAVAHTGECTDAVRESALKVDSLRQIPCRSRESNLPQRRAGLMLRQLNYVPTSVAACEWKYWNISHVFQPACACTQGPSLNPETTF